MRMRLKKYLYIIIFITIVPQSLLFSEGDVYSLFKNDIIDSKLVIDNKLVYTSNFDFIYDEYIRYTYYRPLNLLDPFRDIRINIKEDKLTLFFKPFNTEFFGRRKTTGGLKYNIHKGIEVYYLAYQRSGEPFFFGIESNLGISFSKNLFN